ncbi:tetratricopeptide repeat protein [Actinomycetospora sp. CA-084318]|uniref:tetratricopeptide repeat protein n=1 Tax=Actinomycetospora sp. CA-084318 TaxID=3239892 RepID=UPI003D973C39
MGSDTVSALGELDSADRSCDIWPLETFDEQRAMVHAAVGRSNEHSSQVLHPAPVPYVEREHDPALRESIAKATRGEHHAILVLRGRSSTGKTRSLYEGIRQVCGESEIPSGRRKQVKSWYVIRPAGREALRDLPEAGLLKRSPTVLWLNELQGFLGPNGTGLTRRLLEDLHDAAAGQPLVIVGTIWPDKLSQQANPELEATRDTRELIGDRTVMRFFDIADRLTSAELDAARFMARRTNDERVGAALQDRGGFGFTQALAGAAELLSLYRTASRAQQLVLEGAAEYRRIGGQAAISQELLIRLATAFWQKAYAPQTPALDRILLAIATLRRPLRDPDGEVCALIQIGPDAYTLSDYLEEYLAHERYYQAVYDEVWSAFEHADPSDYVLLAEAAEARGRIAIADALWQRVIPGSQGSSHSRFAAWLERQGRLQEAERERRAAISAREPGAYGRLVRLLDRQSRDTGEIERLRRAAVEADEPDAYENLARWLNQQGRSDEAEQARRAAVGAGEVNALSNLARWLVRRGSNDEAEQVMRAAVVAGDRDAYYVLARWFESQNRQHEAEQVRRAAVGDGEPGSYASLARWLSRNKRDIEAEEILRESVEAGEPNAHSELAEWLGLHGRDDDALRAWHAAVACNERSANYNLASWFESHGRLREAEEAMLGAIATNEPSAYSYYSEWLENHGRVEEAERALHMAIEARERNAQDNLARRLDVRGRHVEAEEVRRAAIVAGDPLAHFRLANWLEHQNRAEEAAALRRCGVDPEGTTVWSC